MLYGDGAQIVLRFFHKHKIRKHKMRCLGDKEITE
ncbi:hypothetical protein SAMN05421787_101361 [Virgibacillus pantothenticus]|nr:hypothetical protein SAMN05421787_101361 [Virgibacillus pantothenticus]